MSDVQIHHLDKAKAALEAARDLDNASLAQLDLLNIAKVQAEVAQAEALTRIADVAEAWARSECL